MSQGSSSATPTAEDPYTSPGALTDGGGVAPSRSTIDRVKGAGREHRFSRRLVLLFVALLIVPPVLAAAWSALQPSTYAAEVDLLHEPSPTSTIDDIDRQLATHQVLLLRRSLIDDAARAVGRDPDELANDVSATVVDQSSILRLRVVDHDRGRAQQTVAFLADRYVGIADQLASSSNIGRVRVVSAAAVLDQPIGPQPLRAGAAGVLVGMVLALGLWVFLRARLDKSRHSAP